MDLEDNKNKEKLKAIYRNENLVRKFNEEFKNYGIIPQSYEI